MVFKGKPVAKRKMKPMKPSIGVGGKPFGPGGEAPSRTKKPYKSLPVAKRKMPTTTMGNQAGPRRANRPIATNVNAYANEMKKQVRARKTY